MADASKKMTLTGLTTLVAVNMMGSGIIMLPASMAQIGAISLLSWIVTAVGSMAIAYSFATHGFIVGSERVGISSLEKESLQVNDDGSVDLYFAPNAPEGQESNWIPTREDFWVCLRLYGPESPQVIKSWKLTDIEKIK